MTKQRSHIEILKGKRWPEDAKVVPEIVVRLIADYSSRIVCPSKEIAASRDVTAEGLQSIVRIENFMDRVSKSDQSAVEPDKNISGITSKKFTPLGKELYRLLAYPRFTPPQMQPGEGFKLFDKVMQGLKVSQALFTHNPMHVVNPSGLFDSDSLNVILTQLQKGTRSKRYKLAQAQRKKDVQRIAYSQTKLVTRLQELHPNLYGTYIELMYHADSAKDVELADSAQHLQQLIALLKDDNLFGKFVGFYWSRGYSTESGHRTRLCLLFDGLTVPINFANYGRVFEFWRESTRGAGVGSAFPFNVLCGHALLVDIYFSARKNRYLRLTPSSSHPHFGVSDLPRRKLLKHADDHLTNRFQ